MTFIGASRLAAVVNFVVIRRSSGIVSPDDLQTCVCPVRRLDPLDGQRDVARPLVGLQGLQTAAELQVSDQDNLFRESVVNSPFTSRMNFEGLSGGD